MHVALVVRKALADQIGISVDELIARADDGLDALGLDSHGLMRVLLDTERALGLPQPLELPDEALSTPATLIAGIEGVVGGASA